MSNLKRPNKVQVYLSDVELSHLKDLERLTGATRSDVVRVCIYSIYRMEIASMVREVAARHAKGDIDPEILRSIAEEEIEVELTEEEYQAHLIQQQGN